MFKIIFKMFVLFSLLLVNVVLFTWCINQLELESTPLKKNLITNVQAEAIPIIQPQTAPRLVLRHSQTTTLQLTHQTQPTQRMILYFHSGSIHLDKEERGKLEKVLQLSSITSSYAAQILFGPTHSAEENQQTALKTKMRAQMVARIIYPYTQTMKMLYRPTLKEDEIIVEFFEPQD